MESFLEDDIIDATCISLDEWLTLIFDPPPSTLFIHYCFPTVDHLTQYVATISNRSDAEVRSLLRKLLIPSGSLECDKWHMDILIQRLSDVNQEGTIDKLKEYDRRVLLHFKVDEFYTPWEGITWILDLLPHRPKVAIDVLRSYLIAHAQVLPDGRYQGLSDALSIVRAKYIGLPASQPERAEFLTSLQSREFECVVERLYKAMGYSTILTSPQKDGGRDIVAYIDEPGKREQVRVECKRYTGPVGVAIARALLGVVSHEKVNKGVLVTSSRFTKGTEDLAASNPRLELISGDQLVRLLNEYIGAMWPGHIDRLVMDSERETG